MYKNIYNNEETIQMAQQTNVGKLDERDPKRLGDRHARL